MNNAELIKALRKCGKASADRCCDCDYYDREPWCESALANDAADALEAAEKRIAELEAQMPKEGEWIPINWIEDAHMFKCSICGDVSCCNASFCNNCGARMKGERNDHQRM